MNKEEATHNLVHACLEGNLEKARVALEQNAEIENTIEIFNPFKICCEGQHVEILKLLLVKNPNPKIGLDSLLSTAFRHGYRQGQAKIVELLVSYGARFADKRVECYNLAILTSSLELLEILKNNHIIPLDESIDTSLKSKKENNAFEQKHFGLSFSITCSNSVVLGYILDNYYNKLSHLKDNKKLWKYLYTKPQNLHYEKLLNVLADRTPEKYKQTCLNIALQKYAKEHHIDKCMLLVDKGADIKIAVKYGTQEIKDWANKILLAENLQENLKAGQHNKQRKKL